MPDVLRALKDPSNRLPDGRCVVRWGECKEHGRYPMSVVDPQQKGFLRPVLLATSCPKCQEEQRHLKRFSRAAIPRRFRDCTVKGYVASTEDQRRVKAFVIDFCRNIKARIGHGDSLIFCGRFGTGKTHLACAIAKVAMDAGFSCQFVTVSRLFAEIHATWKPDRTESELDVIDRYASLDLLIVDEVGAQYGTDAEIKSLFDVLGQRYGDMKSTILISNAPLYVTEAQEKAGIRPLVSYIGPRVLDRFHETGSAAIGFTWESYRGHKKE